MRLLVIKPSSLGDIVHGLQVLAAWVAARADLEVTWVVRAEFAPVVELSSLVQRVIVFERRGGWASWRRLRAELRREPFDLVLDLQGLLRSGLMTAVARAPRKVGRPDAREGARWFYDAVVARPAGAGPHHAVEVLWPFAAELGLPVGRVGRVIWRRPEGAADGLPWDRVRGAVLVFPESRRAEKNWGGFAALTGELLRRDPARRVVWAGAGAVEDGGGYDKERFTNLTGRTAVAVLPGLIAAAGVVVSNDSGPMHIAAARGQRLVALFGPTDPRRFGPYPASSAWQRVVVAPGGDLARLEVATVVEAVESLGAR